MYIDCFTFPTLRKSLFMSCDRQNGIKARCTSCLLKKEKKYFLLHYKYCSTLYEVVHSEYLASLYLLISKHPGRTLLTVRSLLLLLYGTRGPHPCETLIDQKNTPSPPILYFRRKVTYSKKMEGQVNIMWFCFTDKEMQSRSLYHCCLIQL